MILSPSIHRYLLAAFLLFCFVHVECNSTSVIYPTTTAIAIIPPAGSSPIPPLSSTDRIADDTQSTTSTSTVIVDPADEPITKANSTVSRIDTTTTTLRAIPFKNTSIITSDVFTNSTIPPKKKKGSGLLVFLLVFIGLAALLLIAFLVLYVLIKQGRLRVFNRSRTAKTTNEHARMVDSSSIDDRGSPSQKDMDTN